MKKLMINGALKICSNLGRKFFIYDFILYLTRLAHSVTKQLLLFFRLPRKTEKRKTVRSSDVNLERICKSPKGSRKRPSPFEWQKKGRRTRQKRPRLEKGSGRKSLKTGQKKLPDSIRLDLFLAHGLGTLIYFGLTVRVRDTDLSD